MREIKISMFLIIVFTAISPAHSKDSINTKTPSIDIQPKGLDQSRKSYETSEDTSYFIIDQMPEPIGGISGIQKSMKYPRKAMLKGVEGKVYILAYVDENGDVTEARVLAGIGCGCNEEALGQLRKLSLYQARTRVKM